MDSCWIAISEPWIVHGGDGAQRNHDSLKTYGNEPSRISAVNLNVRFVIKGTQLIFMNCIPIIASDQQDGRKYSPQGRPNARPVSKTVPKRHPVVMGKKKKYDQRFQSSSSPSLSSGNQDFVAPAKKKEKGKGHTSAIEFSRAEHDNPIVMPRGSRFTIWYTNHDEGPGSTTRVRRPWVCGAAVYLHPVRRILLRAIKATENRAFYAIGVGECS